MNILIVESGSTKTEWALIRNGREKFFKSDGLNPYFRTKAQLSKSIDHAVKKEISDVRIDELYFYGSGVGNKSRKEILKEVLQDNFKNTKIVIETDLLGAAIACFGDAKGIACILGTGSNSCVYNGKNIVNNIPSLGFILGDEGGGGYFGKKILNDYYYKIMPEDLRAAIEESSDMNLESILQKVYEEPQANRFVASFSKILGEFKDHSYIKELVREGFEAFADKQLAYFEESKSFDIGFVGSIAFVYEKILREVLEERGMNATVIVRRPLERLINFHTNN